MKNLEFSPIDVNELIEIYSKAKKSNLAMMQAESHLKIEWLQEGCSIVRSYLNDMDNILLSRKDELSKELSKDLRHLISKASLKTFNLIHSIDEL